MSPRSAASGRRPRGAPGGIAAPRSPRDGEQDADGSTTQPRVPLARPPRHRGGQSARGPARTTTAPGRRPPSPECGLSGLIEGNVLFRGCRPCRNEAGPALPPARAASGLASARRPGGIAGPDRRGMESRRRLDPRPSHAFPRAPSVAPRPEHERPRAPQDRRLVVVPLPRSAASDTAGPAEKNVALNQSATRRPGVVAAERGVRVASGHLPRGVRVASGQRPRGIPGRRPGRHRGA